MPLQIIRNDITKMHTDAIVNAANSSLKGGGGVDGAIHAAAGPALREACKRLGGCACGQAKITKGYDLPAKYVIHTVGPVWQGGTKNEAALLRSCYLSSLRIARENGCASISFPLISAGAYGYPRADALDIAVKTIRAFLNDTQDMLVYIVIYDKASFAISETLYGNVRRYIDDSFIPDAFYAETDRRMKAARLMDEAFFASANESAPLPKAPDVKDKSFISEKGARKDAKKSLRQEESAPPARPRYAPRPARDIPGFTLDESFREMLLRRIDESGMTDADCYKKANVDRKLFNKIKNRADYHPGKNIAAAFAVALELSLDDTKDMLAKAGYSMTHSSVFDIILEYFIINRDYDIDRINEVMFMHDQSLLGSTVL